MGNEPDGVYREANLGVNNLIFVAVLRAADLLVRTRLRCGRHRGFQTRMPCGSRQGFPSAVRNSNLARDCFCSLLTRSIWDRSA
jgi:hypothetical protein